MTPGPGCSPGLAAGATLPGRVHWQGEVCREDLLMIIRVESPATVRASDSDGDSAAAAAAAAPARLSADEIRVPATRLHRDWQPEARDQPDGHCVAWLGSAISLPLGGGHCDFD